MSGYRAAGAGDAHAWLVLMATERESWNGFAFDAARVGRVRVPALRVAEAQIIELVLPDGWTGADRGDLIDLLQDRAKRDGLRLRFADLFVAPAVSRLQRWFGDRSVTGHLVQGCQMTREDADAMCRRVDVDGRQSVDTLAWTERKLVGFELAASAADLVVVDDLGLDPTGEERFVHHLSLAVRERGLSVLALRYPASWDTGAWSSERVALSLAPESA